MGNILSLFSGGWLTYLIAGLVVAAGAAFGTHEIDANHYGAIISANSEQAALDKKAVSDAADAAAQKNMADLQAQIATLQTDAAARYKDLQDAQSQNATLRDSVASGNRSLSIAVKPGTSGCSAVPKAGTAGPVLHDSNRAVIDPAAANRIVAIVNDGDDAIRKLAACQAYVRTVAGLPEPATQSK